MAAAFGAFSLAAGWISSSGADDAADNPEAQVWALEQAIYEKRAQGDTRFYSSISSEHYLGWPAPGLKPSTYESIKAFSETGEFQPGEVIDVVSDGISIDGDTAISFFSTHRTTRPGGQAVDERYENIHVYVRRDNQWRLVGAMSRRVLPDILRATPLDGGARPKGN
jgi:hypothetical protein